MKADRLHIASIVLVVAAVAVIMVTLLLSRAPGPVAGPVDHAPAQPDVQLAQERLAQGARLSVAAPLATVWKPGTSGSFVLGIGNEGEAASYQVSFFLESVAGKLTTAPPGAVGWFSAPEAVWIDAGDATTVEVRVAVPASAPEGVYVFRAAVCANGPCSDWESSYASLQLPIEVRA